MPNVCRQANPNPPLEKPEARLRNGYNPPAVDIHKERWAEYEKYGKEPAPPPEKVRVSLRIGVFFDGTGNNAGNTAAGLLCGAQHAVKPEDLDASCKPYMSDPDSSYGNDVTNVKKLSDLYYAPRKAEGEDQQKRASRAVYIEGIGTQAGKQDSLLGAGTGRGDTGVAGRVQQAFVSIRTEIQSFQQDNPDCEITLLTFDAFGFSRGAAAARHFANEVVRGKQGPLGDVLRSNAKAFSRLFHDQYQRDIHMGFIGLFDTVASIAGLANLGNVGSPVAPGIKLHLSRKYFNNVLHLVARDEYRGNFPLSRVKPDHPEITLPGAHSDIGGGYRAEAEECVLISPMQALDVSWNTDVTTTSIYRDALQAKAQWLAKGWPTEMLEIVTPAATRLPADPQDRAAPRRQRVYAGLQLKRQVRGELSRVYLRVMHQLAKQKGVRFIDIPEEPQYLLPLELQPLCDKFVAGDYSTTPADESLLKLRYIHTSAHWNHPLGKSGNRGIKVVYINAPTADAVRAQHPHVADWE
ncbi:phospholipase effector Tle1 domain-containing protein [Pseudomonas sp. UBA2684]|uniref:phospholipase effector Tle1 domain-containing protein n=1 Tax=Pseudomonas sp. UBA2684 TaxID=1947311 RepID=UPI000E9D0A76|nr:hypothetical protein [Pseudomonas sp.]